MHSAVPGGFLILLCAGLVLLAAIAERRRADEHDRVTLSRLLEVIGLSFMGVV